MDPKLFFLDWELLAEILVTVIVISFFLERALSVLFESRWYITNVVEREVHIKEVISLILGVLIAGVWQFDVLSILFSRPENHFLGYFITGAIISGGSKASIKLFHDILSVKSNAQQGYEEHNINRRR